MIIRSLSCFLLISTLSGCTALPIELLRQDKYQLPQCPSDLRYAERDLDRPYPSGIRVYRTPAGDLCESV